MQLLGEGFIVYFSDVRYPFPNSMLEVMPEKDVWDYEPERFLGLPFDMTLILFLFFFNTDPRTTW